MKYIQKKSKQSQSALRFTLSLLSPQSLKEIRGGIILKCNDHPSSLTCTPFNGSCLVVTIGGDTYNCKNTGSLTIAESAPIQTS